jgi:hypothetical protein
MILLTTAKPSESSAELFLNRVYLRKYEFIESMNEIKSSNIDIDMKLSMFGLLITPYIFRKLKAPRLKKILPASFYYFPQKPLFDTSLLNNKRSLCHGWQ